MPQRPPVPMSVAQILSELLQEGANLIRQKVEGIRHSAEHRILPVSCIAHAGHDQRAESHKRILRVRRRIDAARADHARDACGLGRRGALPRHRAFHRVRSRPRPGEQLWRRRAADWRRRPRAGVSHPCRRERRHAAGARRRAADAVRPGRPHREADGRMAVGDPAGSLPAPGQGDADRPVSPPPQRGHGDGGRVARRACCSTHSCCWAPRRAPRRPPRRW